MEPEKQIDTGEKKGDQEQDDAAMIKRAFGRWEMMDLRLTAERLKRDDFELKEVQGKHVVMFMGNTGAGKSTIVTGVTTGFENIQDTEEGTYEAKEWLYYDVNSIPDDDITKDPIKQKRRMFVIGHEQISCTSTPGFFPAMEDRKATPPKLKLASDGKEVYFIDCPGFSDNNVDKEYPNRTVVHKIMMEAASVKICLVINYNELICRKGEYALEVITTISRLFPDLTNAKKFIFPLINQAAMMEPRTPVVDHKFTRTIEFIELKQELYRKKNSGVRLTYTEEDILDQFAGADFPGEGENEHLKQFLNFILKNYLIIDPQDYLEEGFKDRSKTMEQLAEILINEPGETPLKCSNPDMPSKLASFLLEELVEKLAEDRLFAVKAVREKCQEYFKDILKPWKHDKEHSQVVQAVENIFDNKCIMAHWKSENKFYKWYVEVFDDYLNDVMTHECDQFNNFRANSDEMNLPLFHFFIEFYNRTNKCMTHELASVTWEDFTWFLDWMKRFKTYEYIDEDEEAKWDQIVAQSPPADEIGEKWKDARLVTLWQCLPVVEEMVGGIKDKEHQQAYASCLGTAINRWLKKSWPECYKRCNDKPLIDTMVKDATTPLEEIKKKGFVDRQEADKKLALEKDKEEKKESEKK